jgi:hypothetical protein
MRKSLCLLVVLASAGLATDAVSQPATRQPLPAGLRQGADDLVMLVGTKGNVSPQRAGTAVVVKPYRPTVDNPRFYCNANPHCWPPRPGYRNNPDVRDHRHN